MALVQTIVHDGPDATITRVFDDRTGQTTSTTVWKPGSELANRDDLLAKAMGALQGNATFIAIAVPTNAQNATQIRSLTRQVNALIRLVVGRLEDTSGT